MLVFCFYVELVGLTGYEALSAQQCSVIVKQGKGSGMPSFPRRELVREGEVGSYHCVNRCVRRAYLCGDDPVTGRSFEHRREWIQERIKRLSTCYAVDTCSFNVMSNHLHLTVRLRPDLALEWGEEELALRWWYASRWRDPGEPSSQCLQRILEHRGGGERRVQELRERLSSLSWFMGALAEPIARRANAEDGCKGRFWEGRFKSQRLLDEGAVLACSVYVDLNPIRAGMAKTPEASDYTSAQCRIVARQAEQKLEGASALVARLAAATDSQSHEMSCRGEGTCVSQGKVAGRVVPSASKVGPNRVELQKLTRETVRADWLCPVGGEGGFLPGLTLDRYLAVLDWTGRRVVDGKAGFIPKNLQPILERLRIDVSSWLESVQNRSRYQKHVTLKAGFPSGLCFGNLSLVLLGCAQG